MLSWPFGVLSKDSIEKSFGGVRAVRGVSLAIARGSITGIVGENGAGSRRW